MTSPRARTLLLAVAALAAAAGARAATIEYLHVGASEGTALGGHAAVRVDDLAYHYQHRAPGLLVLHRDDAATFEWQYRVLQNRTIRAVRVPLPDTAIRRLRTHLNETLLVQRQHLAVREALDRERELLTTWTRAPRAGDTVPVRGAAAFFHDGDALDADVDASSVVARTTRELRATIVALDLQRSSGAPSHLRPGTPLEAGYSVADRYTHLVERLVALHVLAEGRRVLPERLVRLDDVPPLGPTERTALAGLRARLRASIARLPRSQRPDWGLALLVSLARLQAIEASLDSGRLVVVVAPGARGRALETTRAADREFAREIARGARSALDRLRARPLEADTLGEQAWAHLEHAAVRVAESTGESRAVRMAPPDATPTGVARLRSLPRPRQARTRAAAALVRTERARGDVDTALRRAYAYDLLDRNCVTELIRTLDAAGVPGTSVTMTAGTGFVPRVSFARVAATPHASRVRVLPSHRRRRLAAMRAREPDLLVRLREDNVLTSTLHRGGGDPAFAFFTDDAVLPRPLYGVANLAVGLAESGVGLVAAPFDRTRALRRGLRGVLASVPELAFFSVRTGRLRYDMDAATAPPR